MQSKNRANCSIIKAYLTIFLVVHAASISGIPRRNPATVGSRSVHDHQKWGCDTVASSTKVTMLVVTLA